MVGYGSGYLSVYLSLVLVSVYMDQWCGETYDITFSPVIRIKLTASSDYKTYMNCTFTVKGDYIFDEQLMIQFQGTVPNINKFTSFPFMVRFRFRSGKLK